ncbi:reverse transcriptase-like protein [Virgibacillus soli]|uniref:Reverse transcriptase-like protein n=1 Tax=Paracerasibacillus soli TaxID=480284 RepID=A0ABU5CQ41_9BACI|nr:reverse transcriptase-like protein [Virgibacillus soli]MDY0407939.1 reverse transcriptase-like protein [Virgibacillus soli]
MRGRLELTYQTKKGTEATFTSEDLLAKKAILLIGDLQKTGRVKSVVFIDTHENKWTLKELKKQQEEIQEEPHDVEVYFDGGYDKSLAGLGIVIYYEQRQKTYRKRKNARIEQILNNNEAEYAALHLAVQELEELGVHHLPVTFFGDSQVVIKQMSGEWPCYEVELVKWADRIDERLEQLGIQATYQLIPRNENKETDQLAIQALKRIEISSVMEINKA